jgi:hypothetical protein
MLVILLVGFGSSFAQENGSYVTVRGVLKDSKTKDKVIFASVSVPGTNVGTVSNSDGEFTLKVQKSLNAKEFEVSHLGYINKKFPIAENTRADQVYLIDPHTVELKEITVRPDDPRKLVLQAIDKIYTNYPNQPNRLTGFYRETIKQRRDYVSISEAVVDIYKAPYGTMLDDDRVKIFKGRKSTNVKKADTLMVKLQGGPQVSLLLDVVKNTDVLLSPETVDFYSYQFVDIVNINNEMNYIIAFSPRVTIDYPLYQGKLYISVDRMAFTMAEFSLDLSDKDKAVQYFVRKKPAGLRFIPTSTSYLATYKEQDGKYYLNYVRNEAKFSADWRKRIFKTNYTIMSEMAITERTAENVQRIPAKEAFRPYSVLADKVQDYFDENYWGAYNTIEPDESIEAAIRKFNKRIKRQ